jgi:hypothetical protein
METNNHQQTCPNCGYCPNCGRGGFRFVPSFPVVPSYPIYPSYPYTYITWTAGATSTTLNTNTSGTS